MNSSNRTKVYLGIGIAILVLAGLYFVLNKEEGSSVLNRNDNTEENDSTYSSSEYGFSFEIPKDYDLIEVTAPNDRRHSIILSRKQDSNVPENGEGPTAITIDVFPNATGTSIANWVRANTVSNFNQSTTPLSEREVSGAPAVSYSWDGLYLGRSVAFMHDGSAILVSGTYLETDDKIYADFDEVVNSISLEE
jgi:hypothetical protein